MHELVKAFLDKKKAEKRAKYDEKKKNTAYELELYEKSYSDKDEYSYEFPYSEYDSVNSKTRWYKKVWIDLSDEEFEEINKYNNKIIGGQNPVALALTIIAWIIYIGGFIAGIALGNVEIEGYYRSYSEFSFAIALIYWSVSLISGTMMLGFAEIIKLLFDIKNK